MTEPRMAKKGPYIVDEQPGKKHWCACGFSEKQPYCDGAHATLKTGMTPIAVDITEPKKVAWCGCKRSAKKPYCDGTHAKL